MTRQVAAPGSSTLLPVVLTALDGPIGAVQFDLEYDNSATNVIATLGDSSHNSAKSVYYVDLAPQIRRFFLAGMNESPITSGIVLNSFINLLGNASETYNLTLSNIVGSGCPGYRWGRDRRCFIHSAPPDYGLVGGLDAPVLYAGSAFRLISGVYSD